jgi:hypothetical protein
MQIRLLFLRGTIDCQNFQQFLERMIKMWIGAQDRMSNTVQLDSRIINISLIYLYNLNMCTEKGFGFSTLMWSSKVTRRKHLTALTNSLIVYKRENRKLSTASRDRA